MTTAVERRIAQIEAALDELAPRPSELDRFKAKCPAIDWLTCDELMALDELMRAADVETIGDLSEVDQAKASAIYYAAEARRLSGAPKDADLPPEPFDIQAAYLKAKGAAELKERDSAVFASARQGAAAPGRGPSRSARSDWSGGGRGGPGPSGPP